METKTFLSALSFMLENQGHVTRKFLFMPVLQSIQKE